MTSRIRSCRIEFDRSSHSEASCRASSAGAPFQRMTEDLTARAGKPEFVAWLSFAVVSWISLIWS